MNKPPFFSPTDLLQTLAKAVPPPPVWVVAEGQNRLLLALNHVLMQEPQAMERLKRQQGKTVKAAWGAWLLWLRATPAGLLELAESTGEPDLQLTVQEESAVSMLQAVLAGGKPRVDIQGDVQLAAEVGWLVDNLRWDVEEDLSRIVGDATAHTWVGWGRSVVTALRDFLVQRMAEPGQTAKAAS